MFTLAELTQLQIALDSLRGLGEVIIASGNKKNTVKVETCKHILAGSLTPGVICNLLSRVHTMMAIERRV